MNIEKFVIERDKMLMKCSVEELRKFVKKNAGKYYAEDFARAFARAFASASDTVAEITLHKMIVNATLLPIEMRENSALWLLERGYSVTVRGDAK